MMTPKQLTNHINETLRRWEGDGTPTTTVGKLRNLAMVIEGKRAALHLAQQAALDYINTTEEEES